MPSIPDTSWRILNFESRLSRSGDPERAALRAASRPALATWSRRVHSPHRRQRPSRSRGRSPHRRRFLRRKGCSTVQWAFAAGASH